MSDFGGIRQEDFRIVISKLSDFGEIRQGNLPNVNIRLVYDFGEIRQGNLSNINI